MSRHQIPSKNPGLELIVGFDPPLRSFFGQVYDRTMLDDQNDCVAGWPSPLGLGVQPRLVSTIEAGQALDDLMAWARFYAAEPEAMLLKAAKA
jgi:hypothetical protein